MTPKHLGFTLGVNANGLDAGLSAAEAKAKVFARKFAATVNKDSIGVGSSIGAYALLQTRRKAKPAEMAGPFLTDSQRTQLAQGGGFGGGGLARGFNKFGVAGSMFTSVARDSAASLASGAPLTQVFAQQAPQVLQALTMMRIGMMTILKFVLPIAALSTAVILLAGYFAKLAAAARNLEKFKDTSILFTTLADAMDKARNAATKLHDALEQMRQDQKEAVNPIIDVIDALKEQQQVELDIMRNRGSSEGDINRRSLEQKRELLEETKKQIKLTEAEFKLREKFAIANSRSANDQGEVAKLNTLKRKRDEADKLVEDAQLALKKEPAVLDPFGGEAYMPTETDVLSFESNGGAQRMSVAMAKSIREALDAEMIVQQEKMQSRSKLAGWSEDDAKKASAKIVKLNEDRKKLENAIAAGDAGDKYVKGKSTTPDVTDRQRMNLMAVGNSPLLDVSRQQLAELRMIRNQMQNGSIDNAFGSSPR